uniref:Uncharacterized protein n=1 Tax=Tanacetum cinerariifolium TaxID=118510 RepID=A0A699RYK3_TANCI|nr:hypothetical protein [Tanacetum cinerariifolium]
MRRLIWHGNWWSKRSKERLRELVKVIKGYGKSTKEITPTTTIIPTIATATATTTTTTTLSTTSRTEGKRLLRPMLQPQLKERLMLEIYPSVTDVTYTTLVVVLQSVEGVRGWVILKQIVEPDFQALMKTVYERWPAMAVVRRDTLDTSALKEGTKRTRELVREPMWWLKTHSKI